MQLNVPDLLPIGGAAFGVDRLSAFFVVVIAVGAIPAALYAIGYTREYAGKHSLAAMGFAFNVFVAAMILVPLARNVSDVSCALGNDVAGIVFFGDHRDTSARKRCARAGSILS